MAATTSLEILDTTNMVQLAASKPTVATAPRRSTCFRNKANKMTTDAKNSAPDQRLKCHHHRLSSARFGFAQLIDRLSRKTTLQRRPPARAAHPDARPIGMNFLKFIRTSSRDLPTFLWRQKYQFAAAVFDRQAAPLHWKESRRSRTMSGLTGDLRFREALKRTTWAKANPGPPRGIE